MVGRILSYLGSRGLFGRLLVRSLLSVPPDGRSSPEPGLTRLIDEKKNNKITQHAWNDSFQTSLDEGDSTEKSSRFLQTWNCFNIIKASQKSLPTSLKKLSFIWIINPLKQIFYVLIKAPNQNSSTTTSWVLSIKLYLPESKHNKRCIHF